MAEEGKLKRRRIQRVNIDNEIEKEIVTAAIVSTQYLRKVRRKFKRNHFAIDYAWPVVQWVTEYFDQFGEAPAREITNIYKERHRQIRNEAMRGIVKTFLHDLSEDYRTRAAVNVDYLYERTIRYLRKRDLQELSQKIQHELERDDVEKASTAYVDFSTVHRETARDFNPFDPQYIKENFYADMEERSGLLLPGAWGELVGLLERQWFVSIIAPEKRGKTFVLDEVTMQGVFNGLRTVHISLEMGEKDKRRRFWRRVTGRCEREDWFIVPVLDCKNNQDDSCKLEERVSAVGLLDEDGEKPEYKLGMKYQPCTACMNATIPAMRRRYDADFWYGHAYAEEIDTKTVLAKAQAVQQMYGDLLRVKCWPAYEASMLDIVAYLDELEANQGFVADLVVIDYLDITREFGGSQDARAAIDRTWKMAKNLAQKRNCIVVTVEQAVKATYGRDVEGMADTTEDKRKNAHIDVKLALNLLSKDEEAQVSRVSVIGHRHSYFHPDNEVILLQQLSLGQPLLDCAWYRRRARKTAQLKRKDGKKGGASRKKKNIKK